MGRTSPPLRILFFAARDLQRNYFSSLSHHLCCPSKVVWYKDIVLPGFHGIKFLRQANIAYIVDLKLREKQNATDMKTGTARDNSFYWSVYAFVRRMGANFLFLKYFRYLQQNPSEIVAVWNGNKLRQAIVVQAAKCLGRQCAFFENGLLPNTTTLDFQGVNAFNSLPRHSEFYSELAFDENIKLPSELVVRAPEGDKKNHSKSTGLPENFIFVPFQVNTDSQITIHSPWIRNMAHLFEVISIVQKRLQENEANSEIAFVFKEHPSSGQDYQHLHQSVQDESCLMFANEISTQELIEKSKAIITINSTVGFEALLLGKKVIVLGDAFYGFDGLTKTAETEDDLTGVLDELSEWQPDEKLPSNFLRYIQAEYAVPESWTNPGVAHWENLNARFDCKNSKMNRALFMVSTPLNLFMASVVALDNKNDNHARYELCFIDQPGARARAYIDAVKSWKDSPFDAVHVFPARTKSPMKKMCNRRRAFRLLRTIVDELQPDTIAVGSDRRIEFQFAMNYSQCAGYQSRGAYLDDGTFTYVGRKGKGLQESWLDNGLKKMVYGSWWQQPSTVGASEWIDDAYVAFPELVHEALKLKSLHKINADWFESSQFQALSQSLLDSFNIDAELLRDIDVLITLPHASLLENRAGYAEGMQQLVKELSAHGKHVGIKYHPRQMGADPLGLVGQNGVTLLPAVLAYEVLLPGLGNAVIVGDVSTTLLSSKWLRPTLRTIAVASGSYQEKFLDLFQSLEIEVVGDVSVLAGKLQD